MSTDEDVDNTILLWKKDLSWLDVSYQPKEDAPFFFCLLWGFFGCVFHCMSVCQGGCLLLFGGFLGLFFVSASSLVSETRLCALSTRRRWHLDPKESWNP